MADNDFPVFDASGRMLGNQTSSQGIVPNITGSTIFGGANADLPAIGGSAATGAPSIAAAATSAGITGGSIPPAATTGNPAATTGAGVANSWFARGAIVILGFVFVAVGLSQFGILQKVNPLAR